MKKISPYKFMKSIRHESAKLRKSARGQECMIRIPGICNGNNETTVLCHLNGGGTGTKHSDPLAAFGCSACHDEIDRRTRHLDIDTVKMAHLEGMARTIQWWLDNGFLEIK